MKREKGDFCMCEYRKFNNNPRRCITNDALVRSISLALKDNDYNLVYDSLSSFSKTQCLAMTDKRIIGKYMEYLGYQPINIKIDGKQKFTVSAFVEKYAKIGETYILQIGNNTTTVVNKVVFDTYPPLTKIINKVYRVR